MQLDAWTPSWKLIETPDNLRASYGHDVECACWWLDAANALDVPELTLRSWAQDLVGTSLNMGSTRPMAGFTIPENWEKRLLIAIKNGGCKQKQWYAC